MTELIYSRVPVPEKGGRKAINPVHFTVPEKGVTRVYIDGDEPAVQLAYEGIGVEVLPLSKMPAQDAEPKKGK